MTTFKRDFDFDENFIETIALNIRKYRNKSKKNTIYKKSYIEYH